MYSFGTWWFGYVLLCRAGTETQVCTWAANKKKYAETYFPSQRTFCSSRRCHFSSWLVCWLSNTLHSVKQDCPSFLAFVPPSVASFVSLHLPPQFLKNVDLILANSRKLTEIGVFTLKGSSKYNMLFAFLIRSRHTG